MAQLKPKDGHGTRAVHAGVSADEATGAVTPPIHLSSTFVQESVGVHKGFEYARSGNPTRQILENAIAELEGGVRGLAFGSGSAALDTVVRLLSAGDHVVCSEDAYGGTVRLLSQVCARWGLESTFVDTRDAANVAEAMRPNTKLVIMETPTNPLLRVSDIQAVADAAHAGGAKLLVDNTFMSPALQNPLALGADLVYHSATKYIGGHSDVVGGLVVGKDPVVMEELWFLQNAVGAILGPFDSWLLLRGIKTLELRMQRHSESATTLARRLLEHPDVEAVFYPGLDSHPGHDLHLKQARGAGGMLSFRVRSGETAREIVKSARLWQLAESLGAVESLISIPAQMTHAAIPAEIRNRTGVTDNLVRLSVGIEDVDDLWNDLKGSIQQAHRVTA